MPFRCATAINPLIPAPGPVLVRVSPIWGNVFSGCKVTRFGDMTPGGHVTIFGHGPDPLWASGFVPNAAPLDPDRYMKNDEKGQVMIHPGAILMQSTAAHPQCFHLEDGWYPNAWRAVSQDLSPQQLETQLSASGWTFFSMAHSVAATAFGFARAKSINLALKRVIGRVKLEKCNCLEIEAVETCSFLGIPYVRVSAHPRHIQQGLVFSGQ